MKTVTIYTDGACSGNPGPGGWGAVLRYGAHERELSGGEAQTTNNRMELTAVIEALRLLKEPCEVELYSDSKYVIDALSKGWVYGWQKKGWVKSDKKPALNVDLWERLAAEEIPAAAAHCRARRPLPLGQGARGERIQQPLRRARRGREPEIQIKPRGKRGYSLRQRIPPLLCAPQSAAG